MAVALCFVTPGTVTTTSTPKRTLRSVPSLQRTSISPSRSATALKKADRRVTGRVASGAVAMTAIGPLLLDTIRTVGYDKFGHQLVGLAARRPLNQLRCTFDLLEAHNPIAWEAYNVRSRWNGNSGPSVRWFGLHLRF